MRIKIRDIEESTVLAGAMSGRHLFTTLIHKIEGEPNEAEPVFLDFQGIEVATASFLRESVLAFRDIVRGRRSNLYPVVANADDTIKDEFEILLSPRGDVLMTCCLDGKGRVSNPTLIGDLDPKQKITFDLVQQCDETDAGKLMQEHGDHEGVQQTAWNNRLVSLSSLGVIIEMTQGRTKRYRPLFSQDHQYGN